MAKGTRADVGRRNLVVLYSGKGIIGLAETAIASGVCIKICKDLALIEH
jgi:hypothetical protein